MESKVLIIDLENLSDAEQVFDLHSSNTNIKSNISGEANEEIQLFQLQSNNNFKNVKCLKINNKEIHFKIYVSFYYRLSQQFLSEVIINEKLSALKITLAGKSKIRMVFQPVGVDRKKLDAKIWQCFEAIHLNVLNNNIPIEEIMWVRA